ncbi:MAG: hypothetical protein M5U08_03450 [Burkholderiales bacterium]|nr:hypothetical protein [Burkholderiales bacterium]
MGRRQIGALAAEQLEAVRAEALRVRLRREVLDQARELADRAAAEHPAARHVDVAGEHRQHRQRAHGLDALRRVLDRAAPLQHAGPRLREQPRGGADLLGRHPRDGRGPIRRVLRDVRGELLEAVRVLAYEALVVDALGDDDIEHRERERIVGARAHAQPQVRARRELGLARIDDDGLRTVRQRLAHGEARLAVRPRVDRVVAPEQDALGRRVAGVIAHREVAEGEETGVDPRMETLREAGLAPVRRAERIAEARDPADVMAAGAGAERDRLGPEPVADVGEPLGDLVERRIPADPFPSTGPARAETALRVLEPVGVVDEVDRDRADRAQPPVVERRLAVALDLDEAPVAHMHERPASAVAGTADTLEDLGFALHLRVSGRRGRSAAGRQVEVPAGAGRGSSMIVPR